MMNGRGPARRRPTGAKVGSWDLDAVELVLEGAIEPEGEGDIALLRGLAALAVPSVEQVQDAAASLRNAAEAARAAEQTDAGRARQIADLLEGSLALHAAHGDRPCPVCGSGELTSAWRSRTEAEVQRLRAEAQAAHRAGQALAGARRAAQTLLSAPPNILRQATPPEVDLHAMLRAWERWAKIPTDAPDERLIDHLEAEQRNLATAANSLRQQAAAALERLEEAWRPLAATLRGWLPAAREAARASAAIPDLSSAENWLDAETDRIRAERFRPIAERAAEVWASLRQKQQRIARPPDARRRGNAASPCSGRQRRRNRWPSTWRDEPGGDPRACAQSVSAAGAVAGISVRLRRDRRSGPGDGPRARLTVWPACSPRWRRSGRSSSLRTTSACRNRFAACRFRHTSSKWQGGWARRWSAAPSAIR